jgi:hypothetical protein
MAYRLGWVLYWTCLSLAVLWSLGGGWAVFFLWIVPPGDSEVVRAVAEFLRNPIGILAAVGIPVLALYGLGRSFRYFLSGE